MEQRHICPTCGTITAANSRLCEHCAQNLSQTQPAGTEPDPCALLSHPLSAGQPSQSRPTRTRRGILRPSTRRKFLAGPLGGGSLLAIGAVSLPQLVRNVHLGLNTRGFAHDAPYHLRGESYSPDLNWMAMINTREEDSPQARRYIWNYQQQQLTILPTGPAFRGSIWSPNNSYLLVQADHSTDPDTLDLWDVQTQQKLRTVVYNDYLDHHATSWSPDGTAIALLSSNCTILSSPQLKALFTLDQSDARDVLWSPDSQKLAFLRTPRAALWDIDIWDLPTRRLEASISFKVSFDNVSALTWAPDGTHLAIMAHGQVYIVHVGNPLTSFTLESPNRGGLLAWSPDGRYLATAGLDVIDPLANGRQSGVWDIAERTQVRVFQIALFPSSPVALAWSKDGASIRVVNNEYQQENWSWP